MKTFIRVMECWVPDRDRKHLEFGGGLYGDTPGFGVTSKKLLFGRGEGLPGRAWERGQPIVLTQFEGSYFRRTAAAEAAGLSCGIAVPIFAGDFLTAVLVIFCGDSGAGAIELWRNTPESSLDMTLVDGYYGATPDVFEFASRRMAFRKGTGLPGRVWEQDKPVFIEDVGKSELFQRADTAARAGLNRGLGLPCTVAGSDVCVLTLLSARGTPVARRFELWEPDAQRRHLYRADGFCETMGRLAAAPSEPIFERGQGTIGKVLLAGVPAFSDYAQAELAPWEDELASAGIESLAAVPVIREGRLSAVVVWYF